MKSNLEHFGRGTRDVVVFDRMVREEGFTEKVTEKKMMCLAMCISGEKNDLYRGNWKCEGPDVEHTWRI